MWVDDGGGGGVVNAACFWFSRRMIQLGLQPINLKFLGKKLVSKTGILTVQHGDSEICLVVSLKVNTVVLLFNLNKQAGREGKGGEGRACTGMHSFALSKQLY